MRAIEGILLEPVGCLADFPPGPFHEIAARLFGRKGKASESGSREYWHLLNLMAAAEPLNPAQQDIVNMFELSAVASVTLYQDVRPALAELKAMNVHLSIASSLSCAAIEGFLELNSLSEFFSRISHRDNAAGVKAPPLLRALREASLKPENAIFLADTAEGITVAKTAGVNPILMMNDPDEARRLAMHNPAGGVVSLHELPDFVRLVRAQAARSSDS